MSSSGMEKSDILYLVSDFIGGAGGYLGDFTYRNHEEFYPHLCGIDVDVNRYREETGSTRKAFIRILEDLNPRDQARVIRGCLRKYPPGSPDGPASREPARAQLERLAERLERGTAVEVEDLAYHSEVVERAIRDASTLLKSTGATSGVDRIHTALHGYLKRICREANISVEGDPTLNQLLKRIRAKHPSLQVDHPRSGDIQTILNSMVAILDVLNPIRNRASVAHPNEHLLAEDEAVLVMDTARTILNYLNRKLAVRA